MAGQREIERQTRRLQEAEARLQEMALDGEGEEAESEGRLAARRKRQWCVEEDISLTRDLSEGRTERLKGRKRKRQKRISEVDAGTEDTVGVSRTQEDSSVEKRLTDQLAEEEEKKEEEEEEEKEEEGNELEEEEEAMDTGDSSLVPLGRGGTGSRGRVSLGRRLPEWVESAELVETDIAGHSHPIEGVSLPRVIVRNLRRSGITQLFPVQVCVCMCVYSSSVPVSFDFCNIFFKHQICPPKLISSKRVFIKMFVRPPHQAHVIPALLCSLVGPLLTLPSGVIPQDMCVCAPTGCGKTLCYVVPIVTALWNAASHQV